MKLIRRDRRSLILILVLALSLSTTIVVHIVENSAILYEKRMDTLSRAADFYVDAKYITSEIIGAIKSEISNVKYCAGLIKYATNIVHGGTVYHVDMFGLEKNPEVDTIPGIRWEEFTGNKIIVEPSLARALGIRKGDRLVLLGEEFVVYEIRYPIWAPSLELAGCGSIFMRIETARKLLGFDDVYNRVGIIVWDRSRIAETAYEVAQILIRNNISEVSFDFGFVGVKAVSSSINAFYFAVDSIVFIVVVISMFVYAYLDIRKSIGDLALLEVIGFCRRDVRRLYLLKILLIVLISSGISLIIGFAVGNAIFIYSLTMLGLEPVKSLYFGIPTVEFSLCVVFSVVSSYILFWVMLRSYELERALRRGQHSEVYGYKTRSKFGKPVLKLAMRNISSRKLRSLFIVLLVAVTIGCSVAMYSLVVTSEETYLAEIDSGFRWDLCVVLYDPQKAGVARSYIAELPSVNFTEEIIFATVPIVRLIGKRKVTPPFHMISVIGLSGRETLWKFKFLKGGLRKGNYVAISAKIAELLRIDVGQQIGITFVHPMGTEITIYVVVSGIFRNSAMFGGWLLLSDISTINSELNIGNNTILVSLTNKSNELEVAGKISDFLDGLGVGSKIILRSGLKSKVKSFARKLETPLLILIAAVGMILLVILILVISSEIDSSSSLLAVLYAIGFRRVELTEIVSAEYLALCLAALPCSLLIHDIVVSFFIGVINSMLIPIWIEKHISASILTSIIAIHLLIILVAASATYLKMRRIDMEDALRFE